MLCVRFEPTSEFVSIWFACPSFQPWRARRVSMFANIDTYLINQQPMSNLDTVIKQTVFQFDQIYKNVLALNESM